jgi:hypothetical protein
MPDWELNYQVGCMKALMDKNSLLCRGVEMETVRKFHPIVYASSLEAADTRDDFSILPSYTDLNGNLQNRAQFIKFLDLTKKH